MSDNENSSGSGRGCLSAVLVIIVTGISLAVGPFDAYRTIYNCILGDIPVLKMQILDYSRIQIKKQYPTLSNDLVEEVLAKRLQVSINKEEEVTPGSVSIIELWDLVEVYPHSWKDKWIWTTLN